MRLALEEVCQRLADEEKRLVKLFSPPFGPEERYPGYLAGYGAGFRENGGQYTHAGVWLALALLRRGEREKGRRLLELLLAEGREPGRYEAEPFVLAADVCAAPGHEGRAGWTWYTGSAGCFYRTALEELVGSSTGGWQTPAENPGGGDPGLPGRTGAFVRKSPAGATQTALLMI